MIPNILHQTWKSKTDIPEKFRHWRQSFFDLNPDLDYRFYDDADNRALLESCMPQLLDLYDSFPKEIFRVDMIRAVYLFKFGGFYADMDFQCLAPLTKIARPDNAIVLGRMGTAASFPHSIPNALMASEPGEGFWLGYLAEIERSWHGLRDHAGIEKRPEYVTGPVVLKNSVARYRLQTNQFRENVLDFAREKRIPLDKEVSFGRLALAPPHILYPISWRDQVHRWFLRMASEENLLYSIEEARKMFPDSLAVTYWSNSWQRKSLRRQLALHPDCRSTAVSGVTVDVSRVGGLLDLRYKITGRVGALALSPSGEQQRRDELWKHSCFEAFVGAQADPGYVELNFAPSEEWAAYRFAGYRADMRDAAVAPTRISSHRDANSYVLEATIALDPELPDDQLWRLGLSAVIEETDGNRSYWALAHPPGKPDFHHDHCFAIELPPA